MPTRLTAVLVLFATLLAAAPVASASVPLRDSVSIVSIRGERQRQRQLRRKLAIVFPPEPVTLSARDLPLAFPGFAHPLFQRPPPVLR